MLFTNNDSGYRTALDLADAGAEIRAVVDLRPNPQGALAASARDKGIRVIGSHAVVDVKGVKKVKGVVIMDLDQRGTGVRGDAKDHRLRSGGCVGGVEPDGPPTLTVGRED